MANATIRTNFNQTANVLVNFPPQITFGRIISKYLPDPVHLSLRQLIHTRRGLPVNVRFKQNLRSDDGTDTVYATQGYMRLFSVRYVNTGNTNHFGPP